MAAIVYDGVGSGGNLFEGTKFFVQQRVPMRQQLIDWVTSNGGEVVPLEKQADIHIADHARKDCPIGSISWTFIEKSVKNGKLEDIEDHRAGPVTQNIRPVGSRQPTKTTRTPFTAEDDRLLMNWVAKAERNGLSIRGNEIYEQLEKKNNRHTFQSWRDRWIKHVCLRPRPGFDDDGSAESDGPTATKQAVGVPRQPVRDSRARVSLNTGMQDGRPRQVRNEASRTETLAKASLSESLSGPWVAKSKGGRSFTQQEIQLLINDYDDIINIDENEEINAWAAWSKRYPNHTPQEWRNYFNNELTTNVKKRRKMVSRTISHTSGSRQESGVSLSSPKTMSTANPEPISSKKNKIVSKALPINTRPIDNGQTSTQQSPSEMFHRIADPLLTDEQQFEVYVKLLADELDVKAEFNHVIDGKRVTLFRLWQVVRGDFGGIDEVEGRNLWPKVAQNLDIMDARSHKQLRSCYNIILPDVEATRNEFWERTNSQEQAMIESQLRNTMNRQTYREEKDLSNDDFSIQDEEEDDPNLDLDLPLSSRKDLAIDLHSNKRSLPSEDRHGSVEHSSSSKRQRLDKGKEKEKEIPSTPEDGISWKVNIHSPERSPSRRAVASPILGEMTEEASITMPSGQFHLKRHELFSKRHIYDIEPETQDFHFPIEKDQDESLQADPSNLVPPSLRDPFQVQIPVPQPRQILEDGSSSQSETESETTTRLSAFIERCRSKGHTDEDIEKCMFATSLETVMADQVMKALEQGLGIPDDIPGVWTSTDDKNLYPRYGQYFRAVKKKHGRERVKARIDYLKNNQSD